MLTHFKRPANCRPAYRRIYTAIPLLSGVLYLLAFYPGILTHDSLFQWDQAARFDFNNWHPAYHTLLIWLATRLWDSPAAAALLQVTGFGLVVGYGLKTFDELGVSPVLLLLTGLALSLAPLDGMLVVTLWKDVPYSLCLLLLCIYLFKILLSGGEWLAGRWRWLWLGLAAANVALLRYNGAPVALAVLVVALAWARRQRKAALAALGLAAIYLGLVLGPLYSLVRVNRTYTQPPGILLIHPIAAYLHAGAALTPAESAYLDQFRPLSAGWPYSCYDATVLFYSGIRFEPLWADQRPAARLLARLALADPLVLARHFYCLSTFVWKPLQPANVVLETVYFDNLDPSARPDWRPYTAQVVQQPRLPALKQAIRDSVAAEARLDPRQVLWRPAIYLYALAFSLSAYALRRKSAAFLLALTPALTQTAVVAISAQLQAVRYQFPIYLMALLFVPPLIALALSRKSG